MGYLGPNGAGKSTSIKMLTGILVPTRSFIADQNTRMGTTVLLTTHDLDDVERLCRRTIVIDHGRVLYDGDVATLKARYAPYRELDVQTDEPNPVITVPGAETVKTEEGKVWLRFDPDRVLAADVIGGVLAQRRVTDLSIVEPDLESVIHQIYTDSPGQVVALRRRRRMDPHRYCLPVWDAAHRARPV